MSEAAELITCKQCGQAKEPDCFYFRKTGTQTSPACRACCKAKGPVYATIGDERRTLADWARISGVKPQSIAARWRAGVRGKALIAERPAYSKCFLFDYLMSEQLSDDWDDLPYAEDEHAKDCVAYAKFEGGLSLFQVGLIMGMSKERVRQIEESAIRKIRANNSPDVLAALAKSVGWVYPEGGY